MSTKTNAAEASALKAKLAELPEELVIAAIDKSKADADAA